MRNQSAKKDTRNHNIHCNPFCRLGGSCVHITAMFFRIEAAVRGGFTNLVVACTSKACTWNVPSQKTVTEPVRAKDMNFTAGKLNKGVNAVC